MTPRQPDNLPPDWLAAYADGELSPADRARVERWLADDPAARELLETQESFGPQNADLWNAMRPPAPSAGQWRDTFNQIAPQASPHRRAWTGWLGTIGLLATAATLVLALPGRQHPCLDAPPATFPNSAPVAPSDDEPFVMAMADDVRIISLPEAAAGLILVGDHPMRDSLLVLAARDEIVYFGVGADFAGRFPAIPEDAEAFDAPMLWAPRDP
jgi:anti-sigma factor RsiW